MFPEVFEMRETKMNLTPKRAKNICLALNILANQERYNPILEDSKNPVFWHIYDRVSDLIYTSPTHILGAFQHNLLNYGTVR
jgi:hypothetical protein